MVSDAEYYTFDFNFGLLNYHQRTNNDHFTYLSVYAVVIELLHVLFTNFSKVISPQEKRRSDRYYSRIQKIIQYVNEHYYESLTLVQLANFIHLNPDYLSKFMKQYLGMSFYDYLTNIRIRHAYDKLINTDLAITKISDNVAFSNYPQFIKEFKIHYSQLPKNVRKQQGNNS